MKLLSFLSLLCLTVPTLAQVSPPGPKKDPFAGFGNTGLDRKPGGGPSSALSPFGPTPAQPVPTAPQPTASAASSSGIALASQWSGRLDQGSGGQTMKMQDLQALLSGYGSADLDVAAHPEVTIYEGPTMDSGASQNCRITYLMPLDKAEGVLFRSRGIATVSKAVAPGFPDGLFIHTYDVKVGIYNRLVILTDSARPVAQVVSLELKAEGKNWEPPVPPWKELGRNWHTHDYVNTKNKGQPGIRIRTWVLRSEGYITVNTTISTGETTTWSLPQPMIKLILHCLSQQAAK